jgi:hypothetical protein
MFTKRNRAVAIAALDRQSRVTTNVSNVFANVCPHCGGNLMRIRRRPVDRLFSVFVPVRRFRCVDLRCIWEGNVRRSRGTVSYAPMLG